MDVSLIIATRDRCQQLQRCLDAVTCLQFERLWELIIVDNGSTDGTASVVHQFSECAQFPVRYVFESKPGLGNAHNAAIAVARGMILAFTDDDCCPEPDLLGCVWRVFEDPSLGCLAGCMTLRGPRDEPLSRVQSSF